MTDYEAMEAYRNGSSEAFSELYERYQASVLNWCRRKMSQPYYPPEVEDIAQEVWISLSKQLSKPASDEHLTEELKKGRLKNLLYRIAAQRTIDWNRRRNKYPSVWNPHTIEKGQEKTVHYIPTPERIMQASEFAQGLNSFVESNLSIEEKEILDRKMDKIPEQEIASICNISHLAVRLCMYRIRKKILKHLQDENPSFRLRNKKRG